MRMSLTLFKLLVAYIVCIFFGYQVACAGPEKASNSSAADVVKLLYHDYAWEALGDDFGTTALEEQPEIELEKYFESSLAKLIRQDRECVIQTEDMCQLDFKIIFASQDPGAYEMKVSVVGGSNNVHVQFKYPSNQEKIGLVYRMINTPRGWRIHDIYYENAKTSLRELLGK